MKSMGFQNLMRVVAGGVVFVLLAAQQKVCDWPVIDEPDPPKSAPVPSGQSGENESKPEPVTFANTLPDPVAPRWKSPAGGALEATPDQLAARAWTGDGDWRTGRTSPAGATDTASYTRLLGALSARLAAPLELPVQLDRVDASIAAGIFQTCIQRTGPPHG